MRDPALEAWQRFVAGLEPSGPMSEVILASWDRSRAAGVAQDLDPPRFRRVSDAELRERLAGADRLLAVASRHLDWLSAHMSGVVHGAYVVDRDGVVLTARGTPDLLEKVGLLPGFDWSEAVMGTNGAGTALVADRPVAVVGPEHYAVAWHDCTCTAAPLHGPDGAVIGAIDVSTSVADGQPDRLAIVAYAASVIDAELRLQAALEERADLHAREQRAAARLEVLARASRRFAEASLDPDAVLESLTAELGAVLSSAAGIALAEQDGAHLRPVTLYHPDEADLTALRALNAERRIRIGEGIAGHVARSGASAFYPVIDPDAVAGQVTPAYRAFAERQPVHALICVPLRARGRIIGTLAAWRTRPGQPFTRDDLLLVEELGERAATALDNARLYQEAQAAGRAREEVVSVVSHDLRNPLGVISMAAAYLQMLGVEGRVGERVRSAAQRIGRSAERMTRLIGDLLDFASVQTGRLSIEPRACTPQEIVAAVLELLSAVADERRVALVPETSPDCPPIRADVDRVVQALGNLVSNAVNVTAVRESVVVGACARDGEVLFYVRDTGPGIRPEELPRIFDRYWRGDGASYRGTGLGLSIAKGVVEAHGGRIWAESALGVGSTFYFALPLPGVGEPPDS